MLSLKIALRYLLAKKSHRAVNIITLIAVTGVAVATMAMVLVLFIFNGFRDLALSQLSSVDPDLLVVPARGSVITSADSLARRMENVKGVTTAWPVFTGRALLDDETSRLPVVVKGIPEGYGEATRLDHIIIAGQYAESTTDGVPAVQLSVGVANQVSMLPSAEARLRLIVPRRKSRINPANPAAAFRSEEVAFSGVFRVNNDDIDAEYVLMPLSAARDLFDYDSEASAIEVRVAPGASMSDVRRQIYSIAGDDFTVHDRLQQRAASFRMISVEKWVTFMMLLFILVIALFNVISKLSLLAIEKRDNMMTLRNLGAPQSLVRRVFIAEGFLVTTLGGTIGIVLGVVVALIQQYFHIVRLSADAATLTINYYPIRVELSDILTVSGVVVVLAVVISLIARLIVKEK